MKLQILVPQYNETDEVIKPLLDSIALQQGIDFDEIGVIICNDGSETWLTDNFLQNYPFRIEYHMEEHGGISRTRNKCFDYATADYVMFCDADDMFFNMCGIYQIFQDIEQGFDSLVSTFIEENRANGELEYGTHEYDITFVHGKVHRRQFLIDKNIRFKDELEINEDSYFTALTQCCADVLKHCKTPFYLWKWRDNSVCREENHRLKTYNTMIDSNECLVLELLDRGYVDKAAGYFVCIVFDTYYLMNNPLWLKEENRKYRESSEKRFARYFIELEELWNVVPIHERMQMSNNLRKRAIKEGLVFESFTMEEWLKHLKEIV